MLRPMGAWILRFRWFKGLGTVFLTALSLIASGCASDALSLEPPNVVDVTPQPGILSIGGEAVQIDFYTQQTLPLGETGEIRQLDTAPLESIGLIIEKWNFSSAFDFSVTVTVPESTGRGIFTVELPIENEYERFIHSVNTSIQALQEKGVKVNTLFESYIDPLVGREMSLDEGRGKSNWQLRGRSPP